MEEMDLEKILFDKKLAVRSKVWFELNDKPFLGEGRYAILSAIDRHGSIIKAAEETNVSYRRIRGVIREMEQAIGRKLVITFRGGKEGGGAVITELARELLLRFKKNDAAIRNVVDALYQRIFK